MKHSYYDGYLDQVMEAWSYALVLISRQNCNCWGVMDRFLAGTAFNEIYKRENPKYLNMSPLQLLETMEFEDQFKWKKTKQKKDDKDIDEVIIAWVGRLLAYFQWKYSIDFRDWIKYENTRAIYNIYYPLHEASYDNAADKLYERYIYYKQSKL